MRRWLVFCVACAEEVKQQIEAVAMDGSYAYRRAVERELPKAKVCLDRFHLYRDVNHIMQQAFHEISQSKAGRAQRKSFAVLQPLAAEITKNLKHY